MKTTKINLRDLHNEEHFQFQTEFKDAVDKAGAGADKLDISGEYAIYLPLYSQENEALQVIRKSHITAQLSDADLERDNLYSGFCDAVKSGTKHFNPLKRAAADRIQVLLDQYGNVARKSYDKETTDLTKLVNEFNTTYKSDINTLTIMDWVEELDTRNKAFDTLMKSRYGQEAVKTELRMVHVRYDIDAAYRAITERLDALMLLNGTAKYEAFVRELNTRVDKYHNIIAIRKGRASKKVEQPKK
jgi:hypothetical protein